MEGFNLKLVIIRLFWGKKWLESRYPFFAVKAEGLLDSSMFGDMLVQLLNVALIYHENRRSGSAPQNSHKQRPEAAFSKVEI